MQLRSICSQRCRKQVCKVSLPASSVLHYSLDAAETDVCRSTTSSGCVHVTARCFQQCKEAPIILLSSRYGELASKTIKKNVYQTLCSFPLECDVSFKTSTEHLQKFIYTLTKGTFSLCSEGTYTLKVIFGKDYYIKNLYK